MVTVILSCVQLISMIVTAVTTDKIGRRPLTVYPYLVTAISLLCLGITGCFDYTKTSLSSLLVKTSLNIISSPVLTSIQSRSSLPAWQLCLRLVHPRLAMHMQLRSRNNACVQRQPVGLLHCRIRWLSCSASVHH